VNNPPTSGEHIGDSNYVEVLIDYDPPTFFIHVLGAGGGGLNARGVAGFGPIRAGEYALFANSPNCGNADTLEISGSDVDVSGYVHANANVKIPGSDNDFDGDVTRQCNLTVSGSGNTFDPPPPPPEGTRPFPVDYVYSDFPCTMTFTSDTDLSSVPGAWLSATQLRPGVYCSTRKLTLSGSDVTGNVTLVAQGTLNVSGSNFNLTPYWNDVLLFTASNDSSALDVSGSGGSFVGLMIAENGHAKIQGSSNLSIRGSVLANTIAVSGSAFTLSALLEADPSTGRVALVE
jgi:cytoskeletal protein CcmA (bactofilin family)